MNAISFAWTSPALVLGRKRVTRREWSAEYGRRFRGGDRLVAYDHSPRANGAALGVIRLTGAPVCEPFAAAPDDDFEGEGFRFFGEHPELAGAVAMPVTPAAYDEWRGADPGATAWVVRFDVESLTPAGEALAARCRERCRTRHDGSLGAVPAGAQPEQEPSHRTAPPAPAAVSRPGEARVWCAWCRMPLSAADLMQVEMAITGVEGRPGRVVTRTEPRILCRDREACMDRLIPGRSYQGGAAHGT